MKKYIICLALVSLFVPVTFLYAGILKVAVLELNNKAELTEAENAYLTDRVRDAMIRMLPSGGFMIMTRESIQELLPPDVQVSDCTDAKCEVEIGRMLGAEYVVTGDILKFAEALRLNLKIHHCQSAAFLGGEVARGDNLEGLEDSVRKTAGLLSDRMRNHSGIKSPGHVIPGKFSEGSGSEAPEDEWNSGVIQKTVVRFESDPPGAVVLVDGLVICTSTPCSKELPEGPARVSMQKERYLANDEVVDIIKGDGELRLSWILEPDFGWLTIDSEPPGLKVEINDQGYGTTPVKKIELSPAGYRVKVNDERYYGVWEDVLIERGKLREVTLAPKARMGGLIVSAVDRDGNAVAADISVDGKLFGTTPYAGEIMVGIHEVEVNSRTYTWKGKVETKERTNDTLRVELINRRFDSAFGTGNKDERMRGQLTKAETERQSTRWSRSRYNSTLWSINFGGYVLPFISGDFDLFNFKGPNAGFSVEVRKKWAGLELSYIFGSEHEAEVEIVDFINELYIEDTQIYELNPNIVSLNAKIFLGKRLKTQPFILIGATFDSPVINDRSVYDKGPLESDFKGWGGNIGGGAEYYLGDFFKATLGYYWHESSLELDYHHMRLGAPVVFLSCGVFFEH